MVKNICKVVHKPDHEKSDEYIVLVNQAEVKVKACLLSDIDDNPAPILIV